MVMMVIMEEETEVAAPQGKEIEREWKVSER
jgi:hypothetical protein